MCLCDKSRHCGCLFEGCQLTVIDEVFGGHNLTVFYCKECNKVNFLSLSVVFVIIIIVLFVKFYH